jgi:hypothetical protein
MILRSLFVAVLELGLKLELELHAKEGQGPNKVHSPKGNAIFPSGTRQLRYYAALLAGMNVE